jgi:HPt (histidine-containing phosphotransfer) domain-containing protein
MTLPDSPAATARSLALDDLRRAAQGFAKFVETSDHRAELALIDAAIARLGKVPQHMAVEIRDFDPSRLAHLMELTGPDLAQELLARLTEDLSGVLEVVERDKVSGDWKRLREATHVLISLSGSIGALSLQAMAETLNATAHRQDQAESDAILPALAQELQALIAYVSVTQSSGRPAA